MARSDGRGKEHNGGVNVEHRRHEGGQYPQRSAGASRGDQSISQFGEEPEPVESNGERNSGDGDASGPSALRAAAMEETPVPVAAMAQVAGSTHWGSRNGRASTPTMATASRLFGGACEFSGSPSGRCAAGLRRLDSLDEL